jgi:hypothetical protein
MMRRIEARISSMEGSFCAFVSAMIAELGPENG